MTSVSLINKIKLVQKGSVGGSRNENTDDSRNHSQTHKSAYPLTLQVKDCFDEYRGKIFCVQLTTALTIAVRSAQIVAPMIDQTNQ